MKEPHGPWQCLGINGVGTVPEELPAGEGNGAGLGVGVVGSKARLVWGQMGEIRLRSVGEMVTRRRGDGAEGPDKPRGVAAEPGGADGRHRGAQVQNLLQRMECFLCLPAALREH